MIGVSIMSIRLWGNESLVNTTTLNNQNASVVAALKPGGYVIAWVDDMGAASSVVKFQRYDAFGKAVGVETTLPVADGVGDQLSPSIATMPDGGFVIALTDEDSDPANPNIHMLRYSAGGSLVFDYTGTNYGTAPVVNVSTNEILLTYNFDYVSDEDVVISAIDHNGSSIGMGSFEGAGADSFLQTSAYNPGTHYLYDAYIEPSGQVTVEIAFGLSVSTLGPGFNLGAGYEAASDLDIAVLLSGEMMIAVQAPGRYVQFRILDLLGNVIASPRLNTGEADIVSFADNTFAVTYADAGTGLLRINIYNLAGEVLQTGILSPNLTVGSQYSIAKLADNRIIVTWSTNNGGQSDVYHQTIDARDGNVLGSNNSTIAETLLGNDLFNDQMLGFAGNDTMFGLAGADVIYGGVGLDVLNGGRGDDTLYGGNDADSLNGEAGDDVLFGEDGNDRMSGGLGADDLDGGAGDDGVSFRGAKAGVAVNLFTGVGTAGEATGDTYINMESFFGSEFADTVIGGIVAGAFYGFGGDDTITGTAGADRLIGGLGNDTINGLGGTDRVYYDTSTVVQVNLATNVNTGGEAQGDILSNIEEVSGSAFGDTIIGKSGNERFFGNGGNDRLDGGLGADTLVGGAGSDTFVFVLGQSGQTATTLDFISDYAKGLVGTGDKIDFSAALIIGGSSAVATATEASINAGTGVASFASGSGTTLADALADITARMTAATTTAGEFAFFQINNTGTEYLFISDSLAGLGTGDIVVSLTGVTSVNSIDLAGGDITILT
jgi:Ca2+-binding RTX toxin-like protein